MINEHTCISDDGGTPNRKCYACENELNERLNVPISYYEKVFEITISEALALNFLLRLHHGLIRENKEEYEQILRLINGLSIFLSSQEKIND